jgi:branched-subunit amino acid transport protein
MDLSNPWILIIGMGLITVAIRASLIVTAGRFEMPSLLKRGLRYVPPAVLTAIFFPDMVLTNGAVNLNPLTNARLIAGVVAIAVAWFSKNTIITILTGLATLFVLTRIGM